MAIRNSSLDQPRYLFIADPNSKRWQAYEHDLKSFWREHSREFEVHLLPWRDVIESDGAIDGFVSEIGPAVVRIESPARDFEITRGLLQAGERDKSNEQSSLRDWSREPFENGRLIQPGLVFRGLQRVLRGLQASLDRHEHLHPLAQPMQVAEMFDKNATAKRLTENGIPCPPSFPPPDNIKDLFSTLYKRRWFDSYIKLAHGSSASGIAVLHLFDEPRDRVPVTIVPSAITSMVKIDNEFFNTRRLKTVTHDELQETLEYILDEGACIQKAIPMAQIQGQNFDVRIVMIYGEPAFTIFRLSSEPMTNLHLGGRRGDPKTCRAQIPNRAWLDAMDHCVQAASLYDSAIVGVDLVFERGYMRHYVLELNAFGDFFPGLTNEAGKSVHRYEIEATARRF